MKSLADIKSYYETTFEGDQCDDFGNPSARIKQHINEDFSFEIQPAGKGWVGWVLHGEERIAYISLQETAIEVYNKAFNLRNEYVEAALEGAYVAGVGYILSCQQAIAAEPSYSAYR